MGKASSSKKVARAARAAGRPGSGRSYGWPLLIGGVVVVGLLLIVLSRGGTEDAIAPKLGDHWHAAYGIYDCGTFLPPRIDVVNPEIGGLHTHGDGLMHMHPTQTSFTGTGANIENWGSNVGLELTDTSFSVGSIERKTGDTCDDGTEGVVQLKAWDSPDDPTGHLIESDFGAYNPQEFTMWVLAFVPEGTEIPPPPQEVIDALRAPSDVTGATAPPNTVPLDTVPLDTTPPDTTPISTTVPGSAETTAPGDTTPTTAAPGTTATTSP